MDRIIRRIRKQVAVARRTSGRRPAYPDALRAEAVKAADALLEAGYSHLRAAQALDLNPATLKSWQRRATGEHPRFSAAMLQVDVQAGSGSADEEGTPDRARRPVLYGPHGLRVEGLDVAAVAELLRRLS